MKERRASPRAHGPFDGVRFGLLDVNVRIHDLSTGGCFVESLNENKVGESVRLQIDLPDEGRVCATGVVVPSARTLGFAVRFTEVDSADQERIARTVARRAGGKPRS